MRLLCVIIYLMLTLKQSSEVIVCDHLSDVNPKQSSEVIVCDHLSDVNPKQQ